MTPTTLQIPHSRPTLTAKDHDAVAKVLSTEMIAASTRVAEFEQRVSASIRGAGAVATCSGSSALALSLRALGVRHGDEVVIPTYVCRAVMAAVRSVGAAPVLCDVGTDWCLTRETVSPHVSPRTRAIVAVHIFGRMVDIGHLAGLGIPIIEDCAQSFLPWHYRVGAPPIGAYFVLSFHATKLLTTGEGGMAVASDETRLERLRSAQEEMARVRQPLSDLQAALGLSQLEQWEGFCQRRRELAKRYVEGLAQDGLIANPTVQDVCFRFTVRTRQDFDNVRMRFAEHGVQVRRGVDELLHRAYGVSPASFVNAERLFRETLSLPVYPSLSDEDCERVIAAANEILGSDRI